MGLTAAQAQRAASTIARELGPALRRRGKGRSPKFRGLINREIHNTAGILALALSLRPGARTDKTAVLEALTLWVGAAEAVPPTATAE